MLLDDSKLLQLVTHAYRATIAPEEWQAFTALLAQTLGLGTAALFIHDPQFHPYSISAAIGLAPEWAEEYRTYYAKQDRWMIEGLHYADGVVAEGEEVWPVADLRRSEFYSDYLRKYDQFHQCGAILTRAGSTFAAMTLLRPERAASFSAEELRFVTALVPHVQSAISIHIQTSALRSQVAAACNALDAIRHGIILLSASGAVIFANEKARSILSARQGLQTCRRGIHALSPVEDERLQWAIKNAGTLGYARKAVIQLISKSGRLLAFVVSVSGSSALPAASSNAAVAIIIRDPNEERTPTSELLERLYGLTRAESKVCCLLANGKTIAEACEALSVSRNTLKTQLSAVFSKTGVHTQAQLVRIVLELAGI